MPLTQGPHLMSALGLSQLAHWNHLEAIEAIDAEFDP